MSKYRPELVTTCRNVFCPRNGTAYLMILNAVRSKRGLIHGKLEDSAHRCCAIGSYFDVNRNHGLPEDLIDEVTAVNDSMPNVTMYQRKLRMMRWLRWKLAQLGFKRP